MNYSTAIFLINPHVRCVAVSYDKSVDRNGKTIPTEITSYKTMDAGVAVDDLVIIPTDTRYNYTVGKVTAVDLDVDFDGHQQMRWVVGKIDPAFINDIITQENKAIAQIRAAEVNDKKKNLADKLAALSPDLAGIGLIDMSPVQAKTTYEPEPDKRGGAQS